MNKTIFSTIGAAFLASLCCIGPLAALFLGSTSIGIFAFFEPFRPFFGVFTIVFLVFAYSKIFSRDRRDCCNTDASKKTLRMQKHILLGITPIVFILLAFPYFLGNSDHEVSQTRTGVKSEWVINGMTCEGCAAGMEGYLSATSGMNSCKVNYNEGTMLCYAENNKLTKEKIRELVTRNGFTAILQSENSNIIKG